MPKGLLLVTMEPPGSLEEEFNDWYDSEHLPQRLSLPGFETGSRWVCLSGWPRWLAIYDLASTAVLESAAYAAVSGKNSTPWSKRILPRTIGRARVIAEQIYPGDRPAVSPAEVSRLGVARYPAALPDLIGSLSQIATNTGGLRQMRLFRGHDGALWMLASFSRPITPDGLQALFGNGPAAEATLLNLYMPYFRN